MSKKKSLGSVSAKIRVTKTTATEGVTVMGTGTLPMLSVHALFHH